jgi:hypothetical protein
VAAGPTSNSLGGGPRANAWNVEAGGRTAWGGTFSESKLVPLVI